jgi:hypothetical protein
VDQRKAHVCRQPIKTTIDACQRRLEWTSNQLPISGTLANRTRHWGRHIHQCSIFSCIHGAEDPCSKPLIHQLQASHAPP